MCRKHDEVVDENRYSSKEYMIQSCEREACVSATCERDGDKGEASLRLRNEEGPRASRVSSSARSALASQRKPRATCGKIIFYVNKLRCLIQPVDCMQCIAREEFLHI